MQMESKRAGAVIPVSDDTDFNTEAALKDKEGH